jgi:hypothetical protein
MLDHHIESLTPVRKNTSQGIPRVKYDYLWGTNVPELFDCSCDVLRIKRIVQPEQRVGRRVLRAQRRRQRALIGLDIPTPKFASELSQISAGKITPIIAAIHPNKTRYEFSENWR